MSDANDTADAPPTSLLRREGLALGLSLLAVLGTFASFPPANAGFLILVAFVPWACVLETRGRGAAAGWSFVVGLGTFGLGLWWLGALSPVLWGMVLPPLALFFVAFALLYGELRRRTGLPCVLILPLAFTAVEYARSFVATGFPWLMAGHAFHGSRHLIQIADITSAYGLTWLALMTNGLIVDAVLFLRGRPGCLSKRRLWIWTGGTAALWAGIFVYGLARSGADFREGPRFFVVQGNIPQDIKMSYTSADMVWERHVKLTLQSAGERPDIIVWPETMTPRALTADAEEFAAFVDMARDLDVHFLIGSTAYESDPEHPEGRRTFNSAFYLGQDGKVRGRYDKIHLVPGGEYVPFRSVFPVLEAVVLDSLGYVPSVEPGTSLGVFALPYDEGKEARFSTIICYEIVFPALVRKFADRGAQIIVNVTNEGWFKESFEFEQMMALSKFRAVENRVSLVRAANTGISTLIDPAGRVVCEVTGEGGKRKAVAGVLSCTTLLDDRGSFYRSCGDVFSVLVLASALLLLAGCLAPPGVWQRLRRGAGRDLAE
jgi:apolipoprotein N-acyltransferase